MINSCYVSAKKKDRAETGIFKGTFYVNPAYLVTHRWVRVPNTQQLKEERFILAHSSQKFHSIIGWRGSGVWQKRAAHGMVAGEQREWTGELGRDKPFPVTHRF